MHECMAQYSDGKSPEESRSSAECASLLNPPSAAPGSPAGTPASKCCWPTWKLCSMVFWRNRASLSSSTAWSAAATVAGAEQSGNYSITVSTLQAVLDRGKRSSSTSRKSLLETGAQQPPNQVASSINPCRCSRFPPSAEPMSPNCFENPIVPTVLVYRGSYFKHRAMRSSTLAVARHITWSAAP
jgi:hypothetical protein